MILLYILIIFAISMLCGILVFWILNQVFLDRKARKKERNLFKRPITIDGETTFAYMFYIGRNQVGTNNYELAQLLQHSFTIILSTSRKNPKNS